MIDEMTLEVDDEFYFVQITNNALTRKRIIKKDADGHVWHRYDSPRITYKIRKFLVTGRILYTYEGTVSDYHYNYGEPVIEPHVDICVQEFDNEKQEYYSVIEDFNGNFTQCYRTIEEAMDAIKIHKKEDQDDV